MTAGFSRSQIDGCFGNRELPKVLPYIFHSRNGSGFDGQGESGFDGQGEFVEDAAVLDLIYIAKRNE
jgi:hypothetical protein